MTPRSPHPDQGGKADTTVADGVRRAAADINLATRRLTDWMKDPYYKPKYLTQPTRKDLADIRDQITAILGGSHHLRDEDVLP